ncbi:MAG: LPS assembly lipoprotein LptE [Phaeospirillum sp.]|nr:LPS assembly lipoprotein LptE [Phaeospirillum sp.]
MWWSKALVLIAVLMLGPTGCGFGPMYAKGGGDRTGISADLADIRIAPIKDRMGQKLRNALLQRITPQGEPGDYRYSLSVTLTESASDLGYRRDSFATLGNLTMSAGFSLQGDGVGILLGTAITVVSFDYLGPRYASVATERDAEDRAITQLADDIRSQVAVAITRYKADPKNARYRKSSDSGFIRPEGPDRPAERR